MFADDWISNGPKCDHLKPTIVSLNITTGMWIYDLPLARWNIWCVDNNNNIHDEISSVIFS